MIRIPFFKPFIPMILSGKITAATKNDLKFFMWLGKLFEKNPYSTLLAIPFISFLIAIIIIEFLK